MEAGTSGKTSRGMTFQDISRKFDQLDVDGDGELSFQEFKKLATEFGFSLEIFHTLDRDGSGTIYKHEFVNWWDAQTSNRSTIQKSRVYQNISSMFDQMDADGNG